MNLVNFLAAANNTNLITNELKANNTGIGSILTLIGGIGGGILAVILVISIVKEGMSLVQGSGEGSFKKLFSKAAFLVACIALIVVAINPGLLFNWGKKVATGGNTIIDNGIVNPINTINNTNNGGNGN